MGIFSSGSKERKERERAYHRDKHYSKLRDEKLREQYNAGESRSLLSVTLPPSIAKPTGVEMENSSGSNTESDTEPSTGSSSASDSEESSDDGDAPVSRGGSNSTDEVSSDDETTDHRGLVVRKQKRRKNPTTVKSTESKGDSSKKKSSSKSVTSSSSKRSSKSAKLAKAKEEAKKKKKKEIKKKMEKKETDEKRKKGSKIVKKGTPPAGDETTTRETNIFAMAGEAKLSSDMNYLAEGMNLDVNTRTMLAYYDAKTLEDFSMMSEADLYDMVSRARLMNRALPPLQVRKVEVLREWVKDLLDPHDPDDDDESNFPASWKKQKQTRANSKKLQEYVPNDWKLKFRKDLPKLKHSLKTRGENMTSNRLINYIISLRTLLCGY